MNETILICVLNWSKIWSTKPAILFSKGTVEHQFTKSTKSSKFRLSIRFSICSTLFKTFEKSLCSIQYKFTQTTKSIFKSSEFRLSIRISFCRTLFKTSAAKKYKMLLVRIRSINIPT